CLTAYRHGLGNAPFASTAMSGRNACREALSHRPTRDGQPPANGDSKQVWEAVSNNGRVSTGRLRGGLISIGVRSWVQECAQSCTIAPLAALLFIQTSRRRLRNWRQSCMHASHSSSITRYLRRNGAYSLVPTAHSDGSDGVVIGSA